MDRKVIAIHFSWAAELYTAKFANGYTQKFARTELYNLVGKTEYFRLNEIAHQLVGIWHNVD